MSLSTLPDKIFFPLILLSILGMIWLATLRQAEICPTGSVSAAHTDYVTIKISGSQLNRFMPGQGLEMAPCQANTDYVLNLRAKTADFPATPDTGPHFRLAPDIEVALSNQNIKVIIRARASTQTGAKAFEANYFTGPEGASGWQKFALTETYQDHVFDYAVPAANKDRGVDFLGIRPMVEAGANGFEIESVTLERQ